MPNLAELTYDQLEQEMFVLMVEQAANKARRVEVQMWMDKREAEVRAQRVVQYMTEEERAAMAQALQPDAVSSGEEIGKVG